MRKARKYYTAAEKVAIVRRHLLEKEPVSARKRRLVQFAPSLTSGVRICWDLHGLSETLRPSRSSGEIGGRSPTEPESAPLFDARTVWRYTSA